MGQTFDFYTYGGFDIIATALKGVALIFSDRSFAGLYWAFAALGLLVLFAFTWGRALFIGHPMGMADWGKTFFLAILLWFGAILPTGTLIVYDAQTNKMQSIGGLPIGLVMVAGVTNKIQQGFVDIVETALNPIISYKDGGGGRGFDMFSKLYGFVQNDMKWPDQYDKMSLDKYINDCLFFYMATGDINANDFQKSSDLFNDILAQGKSEGIYTVYYSAGSKDTQSGITMTCTDAYNNLKNVLTSSYFTAILQGQFCPAAGYSRDDPSQLMQCLDTYNQSLDKMTGYQSDGAQSILQMYIAQRINNYVKSGNTQAIAGFVASREMGAGMMGAGLVANEFVPIFINVMTALAILTVPVLFLFFATHPLQSISYFIGTFMFILLWGVMDAIIHSFFTNYAYTFYTGMRDAPLSYSTLFTFDTTASRILGILGYIRVAGIMIASSIAYGVLQFGGEAFARVGSSIQGEMEGAGDKAGKVALKPEDQAGYMTAMYSGRGNLDAVKQYGPEAFSNKAQLDTAVGVETARKNIEGMNGMQGATKMFSDYLSAGNIAGAKSTAMNIAALNSMTDYTDQKAFADTAASLGGIEKAQEHYSQRAQAWTGKPASEITTGDMVNAARQDSRLEGAETAQEKTALLKEGGENLLARDIGVSKNDMSQYQVLANRYDRPEDFKNAIADKGSYPNSEQLQKIDNALTGGQDMDMKGRKDALREGINKEAMPLVETKGAAAGAGQAGDHGQMLTKLDAWGLKHGNIEELGQSMYELQQAEKTGKLSDHMFAAANDYYSKQNGGKPVDFFKAGVETDVARAVTPDGKLNINNAQITEGGVKSTWENGKVTKEGAYKDDYEVLKNAQESGKKGRGDTEKVLAGMVGYQGAMNTADRYEEEGKVKEANDIRSLANDYNERGLLSRDQIVTTPSEGIGFKKVESQTGQSLEDSFKHSTNGVVSHMLIDEKGKVVEEKDTTSKEFGDTVRNHNYNHIHEAADGKRYRMTGDATTYGKGKDAVTKMDLRSAMMQEVDTNGNAIGEKYSAGAAISQGKIINLEAEKGLEKTAKDVDIARVEKGVQLGSAMQMALARKPALASFVSDPNLNKYELNANVAETAMDLATDAGKWLSSQGLSVGYSQGSIDGEIRGGIGIDILGTGGGAYGSAKGSIGRRNEEKENVNLLASEYDRVIRQARSEAIDKGFTEPQIRSHIANKIGDFTQDSIYEKANKLTSGDYGADAPVGMAKKVLNETTSNISQSETKRATEGVEGDLSGINYSEGAEPKKR